MTRGSIALLLMLGATTAFAQQPVPEIPFDGERRLPEAAGRSVPRRSVGRRGQLEGARLRLHRAATVPPARPIGATGVAAAGVRQGRQVRPRDRQGLYAWAYAHAVRVDQGRQHLGHRQGLGHGRQVQPRRAGCRWCSAARRKRRTRPSRGRASTPPRPHVDGHFRQPTDVAWDTQGNIFISDGYINSRVAKYDKNGDWVKSWGEHGTKPANSTRRTASPSTRKGNIYVADRGNRRIQVFDPDGKYLREIKIIDVPVPADAKPWFGNRPERRDRRERSCPARRGRSASRPVRTSFSTRPTRFRAASTS